MKKTIIYALSCAAFLGVSGCTDLSEDLYNVIPSDDYGKTPSEIASIVGRAYASMRGGSDAEANFNVTDENVFFATSIASDEVVVPARATGDWKVSEGRVDVHLHQWKPDNTTVYSLWKYGFNGVAVVNSVIYQVEQSGLDAETSAPILAELKGLRAYYYYKLLDWYGNVPIQTDYTSKEPPATNSRAEVFAFVEKELTDNIDLLPVSAYGRFTQNAANMLLARLYLNAEVYVGTPRWEDCLAACAKITGMLEPDYFTSFKTENQTSREIIFCIPYDHTLVSAGDRLNMLHSLTLHYDYAFVISATGNYAWTVNGPSSQPGLYGSFEEGDVRRNSILWGEQIDKRTGQVLISSRTGNPLVHTDLTSLIAATEEEGGRLVKYEVLEGELPARDHDYVLMRYAEALMMQAECNVRLDNPSAARPFVEQIRSRVGLTTPDVIDLAFIDAELRREFVFEDHRRTDNIRFGTFFEEWWEKPADPADHHTKLFPIPAQEIAKNDKLIQNPGYTE